MLGYPATSNRVVQVTRGAQTIRQMSYDNAGNLLTDTIGTAQAYNNRNRMSTATIGAIVWNYTYNGKEQLAIRSKVSPAATTHFIHDIFGNVIAETNGTATGTTREYVWLPETEIAPADGARSQVDRPLAVVSAVNTATPALYYVSVDHLNRPVKMTDAAKGSVWDAVWQSWGGVHSITGTASLDARLPGQWFQAETGLHYNWHRQYDPTVGRYTQPDPLGFVDGPSVYGYVKGLPLTLVDMDGRSSNQSTASKSTASICLSNTCQKCLQACDLGSTAVSNFCRSTPMPIQAKALCWASVYVAKPVCKGYCYANHCADVTL